MKQSKTYDHFGAYQNEKRNHNGKKQKPVKKAKGGKRGRAGGNKNTIY